MEGGGGVVGVVIVAAASDSEVNERGSSLIWKRTTLLCLWGLQSLFFLKTKGIVVGGKIKGARNCGFSRMEDSGYAVEFNCDPCVNAI